jgi:dihydroorotase
MHDVVAHTAARFGRALVMPNLKPPIVTTAQALAYRERILSALPASANAPSFEPLMTLYLTDNSSAAEVRAAKASGKIIAVKYYPAGVTTNADDGVTDIKKVFPFLATLEEEGMPLLMHGEVTDANVDVFDREAVFIERVLAPLLETFPGLKIVFEHITTRAAVDFVRSAPANVAATVTAHHLRENRNAMFAGGIRPHYYCLPVLKRDSDRLALVSAVTSGDPKFFLGTDSAPHSRETKETACGCAGIYTAHAAIEFYADVFEQAGALDRLEGFASCHGADFYGVSRNAGQIVLTRSAWTIPNELAFGGSRLQPYRAGMNCAWTLTTGSA